MKKTLLTILVLFAVLANPVFGTDYPNFVFGTPNIQSVNALAFGPDGILFVGDAQSASVYAIATDDTKPESKVEKLSVADLKEISNTNNNFVLLIPTLSGVIIS